MKPVTSPRRTFEQTARIEAPPGDVFPLLCPVREYDWIPTWSCDLLHTASGVAELGCIFRTTSPAGAGSMTWVVSRYEPPRLIEFTSFVPDQLVMRLAIALEPSGEATVLHWRREYTALAAPAEQWLAERPEAQVRAETARLFGMLSDYLGRKSGVGAR
jgi:hypothetical protein